MTIPAMVTHQAEQMVNAAASILSLRLPPNLPDREGIIAEASFVACFNALIEAAGQHVRVQHAIMHVAVLRGRQADMGFAEIMDSVHNALTDAITARAEEEAAEAEPANAP